MQSPTAAEISEHDTSEDWYKIRQCGKECDKELRQWQDRDRGSGEEGRRNRPKNLPARSRSLNESQDPHNSSSLAYSK